MRAVSARAVTSPTKIHVGPVAVGPPGTDEHGRGYRRWPERTGQEILVDVGNDYLLRVEKPVVEGPRAVRGERTVLIEVFKGPQIVADEPGELGFEA